MKVLIRHLYVSPGHNYFGHHGQPAGTHLIREMDRIVCRAGRGIEGDRFFDYKPDYKGQITFFSWEVYETIRRELKVPKLSPDAFRRNVLLEGLDLNLLDGRRFDIGGISFEAAGEAKPCYWMNGAVAPGAEAWLRGRGGMRARILSDGALTRGPAELTLREPVPNPPSAEATARA